MQVVVRLVHKISSHADVQGPYSAHEGDFDTLETTRRWFARTLKMKLGRVRQFTGQKWWGPAQRPKSRSWLATVWPSSGIWHSITVERGSGLRLPAREIEEMAHRLKMKGYSQPNMYARKLYREGVRLKGYWTEAPGPKGHPAEGAPVYGQATTGKRHVAGVEERLWSPRGETGSLEKTHGFRDRSPARRRARVRTRRRASRSRR